MDVRDRIIDNVRMVVSHLQDLVEVWQMWFSGRSTSGVTLWGIPMITWGRIGKCAQFTAGLIVVLDLLDAEKLRNRGNASRDMWRKKLSDLSMVYKSRDIAEVGTRIFESLCYTAYPTMAPARTYLAKEPQPVSLKPYFTDGHTLVLYAQIRRGLGGSHSCRRNHGRLCRNQLRYIDNSVTQFLHRQIPPDHHPALHTWPIRNVTEAIGRIAVMGAFAGAFAIFVPNYGILVFPGSVIAGALVERLLRRFDGVATIGLFLRFGLTMLVNQAIGHLFWQETSGSSSALACFGFERQLRHRLRVSFDRVRFVAGVRVGEF